jgi:glycosyltransferase involved in cell wall biosynthesis
MGGFRILSVVWYRILPARFGGQRGIAEFNAHLSEHLPLTCLCSGDNDPQSADYEVLNHLPVGKRQVANPLNWWRIVQWVRKTGSTHLITEHCYYAPAGWICRHLFGIPWILHEHNIEYQRFRQMGKRWWPMLRILESWACRQADLVLFKTPEDRGHAIEKFGIDKGRARVVPFGISRVNRPSKEEKQNAALQVRQWHEISANSKILFFSGTLDYGPNADGFRAIAEQIIPILERILDIPFVVIICGRIHDPAYGFLHRLRHDRLCFAGEVEDIQPYFLAADVFLNPVLSGGGIKVKTMEALSYDLPVVSTAHSAMGIDRALTGTRLKVSDDDDMTSFCRLVAEAIMDDAGIPDAYYLHYQWKHLTLQVAEAIEKLSI